ncbi:MAG: cysteine--tRNA ligase, partial [Nocardioidaceae bacterium]|nr:cysteine--tRNA ligase [Nocardioidaceae bacterium]
VREGNKLLAEGDDAGALALAGQVVAMLDVLGLNPADPAWGATSGGDDTKLTAAVEALVQGLLTERADARAAKDWARADAIRDRLKDAGIELEDTPTGPKWSI